MMTEIRVTCFTDLKGSTALTEELGHDGIRPLRSEHLRVGKILAEGVGGNYVKNIGDAHMVTFTSLEPAFHFATQLQQYHAPQLCYASNPLEVRVSLYLGPVDPIGEDVFGVGVNRAARVEGFAQPGEVWVSKALVDAIAAVW